MHYLMLITLSLSTGATSEDARHQAYAQLVDDGSFCGEGGRFGAPLCDWFVIGGRWTGTLQRSLLGDPYEKAMSARFPELTNGVSRQWIDIHRPNLNRLWHRCGGNGYHPLVRDHYETTGCEDDAMLVDRSLYQQFLAEYAGQTGMIDSGKGHFADLNDEPVDETFIGRKWLIVVDLHS